ncbi:glutamine synthetase III family protein [Haliovirga abyssi]|uniref:Glutamine synthetase n=1 Tax=Haliovirga abyssi TaxID=2996794 RepID=A0AAU9DN66_9FUSO|nr:glutamine synthetase III [Haliovirga abyssi]BDU49768.1 glutamine synthetase [Haliovirga abyssi]
MYRKVVDYAEQPLEKMYGENSFSDAKMRERLPKSIYKEFKKVQNGDKELTIEVAEVLANAIKDWAIEKGATHYTHWFQPLTGLTAEKHDSFISPTADGSVILEFSGKELIQGEPDASSFPNGGLRATFEARGYTAWDVTSPIFLKEDNTGITLYIPTAFISYTGEALDKKVPLLRSMDALNKQAMRVLKALGNKDSKKVITTVGPEQEYFLVDKEYFEKRMDLVLAGRTVFGAMPPKGQEMDDHYFGQIKDRVAAYMRELDYELWKLGIAAKTKHNEVAPNQFELAVIFGTTNVAADHNQLVMETMRRVAGRHNLVALLHEKPYAGVNGSGKHNNWSMATDDGKNLLEPGKTPHENMQFLLFMTGVIKAVDKYAPMLRLSAANAGNDHRLGANEAPPAIISIFLGDLLSDILEKISNGEAAKGKDGVKLELGTDSLPKLPKDLTDRNRTSPFAFTGNKFEFRMVASSDSISGVNVILNTMVADVLKEFADELENATDKKAAVEKIIKDAYSAHKRVVFNGDGYAEGWVAEAEKRGLPNLKSTVDVLPEGKTKEVIDLFTKHGVFTEEELVSRFYIYSEKYSQQINIEANIMVEMANMQIFPSANKYAKQLADTIKSVKEVLSDADTVEQEKSLKAVLNNIKGLKEGIAELEKLIIDAQNTEGEYEQAKFYREKVLAKMEEARVYGDNLEKLVEKELWPFPTYEDLLFRL